MELTELGYYPKKVAKSQPQKPARNRCHASTCSSVRPCCHLSDKNYRFSDNLPHSQALLEDQLSRITWILRKFADSGKKHFRWKRADVLRKPNSFFDLL